MKGLIAMAICKICGAKYEGCNDCMRQRMLGGTTWKTICCSTECFDVWVEDYNRANGITESKPPEPARKQKSNAVKDVIELFDLKLVAPSDTFEM